MTEDSKIRQRIVKQLEKLSGDKLRDILEYLKSLESGSVNKKKILSYAGSWSEIDEDIFSELTNDLIKRRKRSSRRGQ